MATLEITFRCMCFFVPDEKTQCVYVLLPATGCGGVHGHQAGGAAATQVAPHVARVVFPSVGGPLNAAGDARVTDRQKDGKTDFMDIAGYSLVLPGTGAGAQLTLDPKIIDLSELTGSTVPRALFSGTQHPAVAALITLDGGKLDKTLAGAYWNIADRVGIPIAQQVTWKVKGLPAGPLNWSRIPLTSAGEPAGTPQPLPPLHPNARGQIRIRVHHVMNEDFPRAREARGPALSTDHFVGHYGVLNAVRSKPLPTFHDRTGETKTYDCLTASGRPD